MVFVTIPDLKGKMLTVFFSQIKTGLLCKTMYFFGRVEEE